MTAIAILALAVALVQTVRHRRAWRLARTDELTGLLNRRAFEENLARRKRRRKPIAVVFVDLDYLKRVNDTHGHAAGDELLQRVASTLHSRCRATDLVSRFGGDEFAILVGDGDREAARTIAMRIEARLADASVGWSSGSRALAEADRLMYERKRERKAGARRAA